MSKKMLVLLTLIISTIFTGCIAANDAVTIYNKALEKTEEVQRYHETSSFEIILKNKNGEYRAQTYQDIVKDRGLGIASGTVKVQDNKDTAEFEVYEKKGSIHIKELGSEKYINSPRKINFIPDVRQKCIDALIETVEMTEDKETLNDKIFFEKDEKTGQIIITSKIQCKKIEKTMFEIVKESIVSKDVKKEVVEETVKKMKETVESLGEDIAEAEIKKAVSEQIEAIDKEFQKIFDNYKCTDFTFIVTINQDGYISKEDIIFKGSGKGGEGTIDIKISRVFKGPSSAPISSPKSTK